MIPPKQRAVTSKPRPCGVSRYELAMAAKDDWLAPNPPSTVQ
jgi:hypothetical protein